jgi:hypothetical protein
MADENPTGRGSAVVLTIPADQARFLRGIFTSACAAVRDELREYPDQLKDPDHLRREVAAYERLLAALDERVIAEHEALHGLLGQLIGGEVR